MSVESSTAASPANPRVSLAGLVALTTFAQIGTVMGIAVFPVVAPELARAMGVDASLIGFQMSLIYGAAMLSSPFLIWMVTRHGACRAIQAGLVCSIVGLALGLLSNLAALAAASILLGVAMSVMTPAGAHVLFRFSPPQHRNFVFSIKQTCVPAGWMLMALIAPAVTLAFGWQAALVLVMMFAATMVVLLQRVRAQWDDDRGSQAGVARQAREGMSLLWRYPVLRWLSVSSMFLSGVQLCLSSFAVTMLVQEVGYSLVAAGLMLSVTQGAGVLARVAWGWIADHSGDCLGVLVRISAVSTLCCLAMSQLTSQWPQAAVALLFVVFGATAIGWNGLFLAEVARCSPPGKVGVATSGAMVWSFAGILIGPALFAMVVRASGSYALTFGLLALFAAAGFALLVISAMCARREVAGQHG